MKTAGCRPCAPQPYGQHLAEFAKNRCMELGLWENDATGRLRTVNCEQKISNEIMSRCNQAKQAACNQIGTFRDMLSVELNKVKPDYEKIEEQLDAVRLNVRDSMSDFNETDIEQAKQILDQFGRYVSFYNDPGTRADWKRNAKRAIHNLGPLVGYY